jgi:tetratricopeptide (TPR) repeat protein
MGPQRLLIVLPFGVLLASSVLHADDATQAIAKKELGKKLFAEQRYEEALEALKESNRLRPSAGVVLTIADTLQYLGSQEEQAAAALRKVPTEKARRMARAEVLFRDAYNWLDQLDRLPATAADRKDAESLYARLRPKVATIDVASDPEGAEILVDGQSAGVGKSLAVAPGEHQVALKLAGYRIEQSSVTAAIDKRTSLRIALQRLFAPLVVQSQPPGARVHLAGTGQLLGSTPLSASLPTGRTRIVVALDGYLEQARDVEILEDAGAALTLTLERAASTLATLSVSGNPEGAVVAVDDRSVGAVPLSLPGLEPKLGKSRLTVTAAGYEAWSGVVPLEAGGATRVRVDLSRSLTRHWRGWKWLGYVGGGALLAGGVTVGLLARNERNSFFDSPSRDKLNTTNQLNLTADILMGSGAAILITTAVLQIFSGKQTPSRADVALDR